MEDFLKSNIDFVVLWVDSSDLTWQKDMNYWKGNKDFSNIDVSDSRYRDWGLFKYWFRAVEKNAPWVRKIHLVTNDQVPSFLNLNNSKIQLDVHSSFMIDKSLPSFNSNAIEMQIPFLEDLSEQFVYFNDDMFVMEPVTPCHFFRNGKRVDLFCERSFLRYSGTLFHGILDTNRHLINKYIHNKRDLIKNIGFNKWFSKELPLSYRLSNLFYYCFSSGFAGFSVEHGCSPLFKSECLDAIDAFYTSFEDTITHKFRTNEDINQYLFRYWSIIHNTYVIDKSAGCQYFVVDEIKHMKNALKNGFKFPIVCINDTDKAKCSDDIKNQVVDIFETLFPEKSSFEK